MAREFYLKDGVFGPHDTLAAPDTVVRTTAQAFSEPQKAQARANIGVAEGGGGAVAAADITDATAAGRAVLTAADAAAQRTALGLAPVAATGAYSALSGLPTLGTAAALNVPASGNAASGEVVKGNDTRLSSGGMAIGGAVAGAAANKGLYVNASGNLDQPSIMYGRTDTEMYTPVQQDKANAVFGGFTVQSPYSSGAYLVTNAIYNGGAGGFIRQAYGAGSGVFIAGTEIYIGHFGNGIAGAPAALTYSARYDSSGLEIYGRLLVQKIRTTSYTLAALNSAIPSPAVGDRSFITDETTGAFGAASVGGGSLERPVFYGNGAWRNG